MLRALFVLLACLLPVASAQEDYNSFVAKLAKAVEYGDEKGLDRAVREAAHHALLHYEVLTREAAVGQASDPTKATLRLLEESWQRLWPGTKVLANIQEFISLNLGATLQSVDKAVATLNQAYAIRDKAWGEKDVAGLRELKRKVVDLANQIQQLGHKYRAAEAWALAASILHNMPEATVDDLRDEIFALEQFVEQRTGWDWTKDQPFLLNKNLLEARKGELARGQAELDKRKAAGYDPDAKGADALVVPNAPEEIVALEFKPLAAPQQDLFWRGGPVPPMWMAFVVNDHGPAELQWFKGSKLYVMWESGNKYGITRDGTVADPAKAALTPITASAKLKPSTFFLDDAGKRPYAMWFFLPGESEPMMGLSHNLAPREKTDTEARSATLHYLSASSWTAKIAGETVTFYDDNSNGKLFEEDPMEYGLKDRSLGAPEGDGLAVPAYDSMRIGKGPLQPCSSFVQIGSGWYHLRPHDDGAKVGVRPLNPEFFQTGTVTMKWNGPPAAKPESVVLRGRGTYAGASYNVANGKPVPVPAGEYELLFGRIQSGKGSQVMTAAITRGDAPLVVVEAGKGVTLELGAPFRLEFVRGGSGDDVEIDALRFRVLGKSGEQYARFNNAPLHLEALCNKTADLKGAKAFGEFVPMPDTDTLNKVASANRGLGIEVGFFPVVKGATENHTVLKAKLPVKGGLVGMQDKKHKLLGKIDPVWK